MTDIKLERKGERFVFYVEETGLWREGITDDVIFLVARREDSLFELKCQQYIERKDFSKRPPRELTITQIHHKAYDLINGISMAGVFDDTSRFLPLREKKVLDLSAMQVIDRTSEHRFTFYFNANYIPTLNLTIINDFFDGLMRKEDQERFRQFLKEVFRGISTGDLLITQCPSFSSESGVEILIPMLINLFGGNRLIVAWRKKSEESIPALILCDYFNHPDMTIVMNHLALSPDMDYPCRKLTSGHEDFLLAWIFA